ncbi:sigma-70 family RNA polymerase sigma factor [Streptomyces sp. NPDC001781]
MSAQQTIRPVALVEAARRGDPDAQDALVSAYLPLVYNIVGRALNGSVDVDDVVQDTMLRALDGLGGLRDPLIFRSWLVAIAMNRVRSYWQDVQGAPVSVEEAPELVDPGADFVDLTLVRLQLSGQRQETARGTRWLEPDDRGLLSLWWLECAGELTRAEVATALELSPQHTAVRVQRMKARLESARVVVRALDARPPCAELGAVLESWDGRPSALWRKRIARHARDCLRCAGLWSGLMPAEGLLAGLALVPVSAGLLAALRSSVTALAPTAALSSLEAAGLGEGSRGVARHRAPAQRDGAAGGRVAASVRRRRRSRRRVAGGAVCAVCVVCVAGGGLWRAEVGTGSGRETDTAARTTAGLLATPAVTGGAASVSASSSVSASPSRSASASSSPSRSPRAIRPTVSAAVKAPLRPARPASRTPLARSAPSGTVARVIALVNDERAKAGCGPVSEDRLLDAAAQGHSEDMGTRRFFDHTNPDGAGPDARITAAGYRWSAYGENIAQGQRTAESVMAAWMNSPGHRANILNCSFRNLGVGVHEGSGGPWWTQDFGARM